MQKKAAYTLQCSDCEKRFPIVVMIEPDKKTEEGISSREVNCPFCKTMLSFKLQETLAPNEIILKTYKKAE